MSIRPNCRQSRRGFKDPSGDQVHAVHDTIDLCPGKCGAPAEQATTIAMSRVLGAVGTSVEVLDQQHADAVNGVDVWDKIDRSWIAHAYVAFDTPP
jgi:hypothetical protein